MIIDTKTMSTDTARQLLEIIIYKHGLVLFTKNSYLKLDPDNLSLGNRAGHAALEYDLSKHPNIDWKTRTDPY